MRHVAVVAAVTAALPLLVGCPAEPVDPLTTTIPEPGLTGLDPAGGPATGGTRVTVRGTALHPLATVWFGASPARAVAVADDGTEIVCTTPPGENRVDVRVANPGGREARLDDAFAYVDGPTLLSVEPSAGAQAGGTLVRVTATDLQPGDGLQATLGGKALDLTDVGTGGFSFVTPPGRGRASLRVVNPDGQQDVLADAFDYVAPPRVRTVRPASGPEAGGTRVTVTGSGFRDGATVTFGDVPASEVEVLGDARVMATTPPGTGLADVAVHDPDFDDTVPLDGGFEYLPTPVVESVDPPSGPEAGGTRVTVRGLGILAGRTVVRFGGEGALAVEWPEPGVITATTPPGRGPVAVTAVHEGLSSAPLADAFTYVAAPRLDAVEPGSGPTLGGHAVVLTGAAFQDGMVVAFGDREALEVAVESAERAVATTPASAAGPVDVVVRNPDGQTSRLAGAYTFVPPPNVVGVSPDAGCAFGGYPVEVEGADFSPGVTVAFGDAEAEVLSLLAPGRVRVLVPEGEGTVDVTVTNHDGQTDTLAPAFTYDSLPRPARVTPRAGPVSGGTALTVEGACLHEAEEVRLGDVALADLAVVDHTALTGITPSVAGEGPVDVVVRTGGGDEGLLVAGFSFHDGVLGRTGFVRGEEDQGSTTAVAAADLDGDGLVDLLLARSPADGLPSVPSAVAVNAGGGTFNVVGELSGRLEHASAIAAGDLDGDGLPDVVVGLSEQPGDPGSGADVAFGNAGGLALEPVPGVFDDRSEATLSVRLADVDGDGDLDIVRGTLSGARLSINEGDFVFTSADDRLGALGEAGHFVVHALAQDLDGDDDVDLIFTTLTGGVALLVNDGRGFFADVTADRLPVANPDEVLAVAAGDLDGDGDTDLVLGGAGPDHLWLQEDGVWVDVSDSGRLPAIDGNTTALALGDLDGDGAPDLVVGLGGADHTRNRILYNDGDGTFEDATERALPAAPPDRTQALWLGDLDGDGVLDLYVANAGADLIWLD